MLESLLNRVLRRYLSSYVEDIITGEVSLWGGDVVLRDLQLRPNILEKVLGSSADSLE